MVLKKMALPTLVNGVRLPNDHVLKKMFLPTLVNGVRWSFHV